MSRPLPEISREHLSRKLYEARERKGWTLEQLSRELWLRGFRASQNKLWRLENKPPHRVDTELLLWLEKLLQVELFKDNGQTHVLIEDVIALLDAFHAGTVPPTPDNDGLRRIHRCHGHSRPAAVAVPGQEAGRDVVIDHSDALHQGVADRAAGEREPASPQIARELSLIHI